MEDIEHQVRNFYDSFGWQKFRDATTGEDVLHRSVSRQHQAYYTRANRRIVECFSNLTGRLLIAGCGDLPNSHIELSQQFSSVCCLDISQRAPRHIQAKFGNNNEYVLGSILDIPKLNDYFDAIYCAHVIYHIDRELQQKSIREIVRVLRPGGKALIIYNNPQSLARMLSRKKSQLPLLWRLQVRESQFITDVPQLYFHAHPLEWWLQFGDECNVRMLPWDPLSTDQEHALFIKGLAASCVYRFCSRYEKHYPDQAARYWSYPAIMLDKKQRAGTDNQRGSGLPLGA